MARPAVLRSARSHYNLSALIARRAVREAGRARQQSTRAAAMVVATHQVAQATVSQAAVTEMLLEQSIDDTAEALLNSVSFTTSLEMFEQMVEAAGGAGFDRLVESLVQDAGRAAESVSAACRAQDIYHVRYLSPPSCSRCAVLAGRVYRWSEGFQRHPNCDCVMIPTTVAAPNLIQDPVDLLKAGQLSGLSKADQRALLDGSDLGQLVNTGRRAAGLQEAGRVLARSGRMTPEGIYKLAGDDREQAIDLLAANGYINRKAAPRRGASGSGVGGGKPPSPPTPASAPEPDPADRAAYLAYWKAHQDALAIDFHDDVLEPHEVRFIERFIARGETVQWIPRSARMVPTNDFIWTSNANLVIEVKSTKAKHSTIRGRIEDAVRKAQSHGVVKDSFLIDIGTAVLTDELRRQLAGYNAGRRSYQIARLWVLSEDGRHFEEISLLAT